MRRAARDVLPFAPAPDRPVRNRLALPILCAAVLVGPIDTSVVNLATRSIGEHFGGNVSVLQWV